MKCEKENVMATQNNPEESIITKKTAAVVAVEGLFFTMLMIKEKKS